MTKHAEKIRVLLRQGLPFVEISRRIGCAKSTVSFHAQKLGVEPPKRLRPPPTVKMRRKRKRIWQNMHGYIGRVIRKKDGTRTTSLMHREVMEFHLGSKLRSDEHVHHKNGVRDDNRLDNLELLSAAEHASHHRPEPERWYFECPECGAEFMRFARRVRDKQGTQGAKGPFCSRYCAGLNNQRKQSNTPMAER